MLSNDITDMQIFEVIKKIASSGPYKEGADVPNYVMQDIIDKYREECSSMEELKQKVYEDYGDTDENKECASLMNEYFAKK